MRLTILFLSLILFAACSPQPEDFDYDLQGHRGARGLLPENTIPSFLIAIDYGVDTIEFDLVVTADERILISHDPGLITRSVQNRMAPRLPKRSRCNSISLR